MSERRVVITGVGAISPLGLGYGALRDGLLEGRHGIVPISLFDASLMNVRVAAEAAAYHDELLPSDPRHHVVLNRSMRLALVAAAEAVASAGLSEQPDVRADMACLMAINRYDINLEDFGESFARAISPTAPAGDGPSTFSFNRQRYLSRTFRAAHPLWLLKFIPNLAVAHVVRTFGMQCEANMYTAEAAASLQLLGDAAESIREGLFDAALCGASDSRISPIGLERYASLDLLATGTPEQVAISKPFDRCRSGYVMGEGAVFFVVESLEHARKRGARPLAEIAGWGQASDAFHPYRAHPEGRGLQISMARAIDKAGLSSEDVDLVAATAASLSDLDAAEATALRATFPSTTPLVTAPAGAIGRTHTAVGAFGAAALIIAIAEQAVPPTANTIEPDSDAPAGLVIGTEARPARIRTTLANAYSFGGPCASVVLREVDA